jgi:hypothetical protein
MKKLTNIVFMWYQIGMTTIFIFGLVRVTIGLLQGDFNNVSFTIY